MMSLHWSLVGLLLWSLPHIGVSSSSVRNFEHGLENDGALKWQQCDVFFAPSPMGWGVYAARPFHEGEMIDITPLIIPIPMDDDPERNLVHVVKNSVLNHYVYGYLRNSGRVDYGVLFGHHMFFNHHPNCNAKLWNLGGKQNRQQVFHALRNIEAGEEIFANYDDADDGLSWFAERNIQMKAPKERKISNASLPHFVSECCSKIYAGISLDSWNKVVSEDNGVAHKADKRRFAPFDAGLGDARAKEFIQKGERIEVSPGLIMSSSMIDGSPLAPLVFRWENLKDEHQSALRILREAGQLKLQHQSNKTGWECVDQWDGFERLSILPAGRIVLVQRVGQDLSSNCRLNIPWQGSNGESVTVALELYATRDIEAGEVLLLDLPPSGSPEELAKLEEELVETNHPYESKKLFGSLGGMQ